MLLRYLVPCSSVVSVPRWLRHMVTPGSCHTQVTPAFTMSILSCIRHGNRQLITDCKRHGALEFRSSAYATIYSWRQAAQHIQARGDMPTQWIQAKGTFSARAGACAT